MNKEINKVIKKDENKISLPKIINSEVNLLVLPFFFLYKNTLKNKLETEYKEVIQRNGEKVEILWNVSANPRYGYPGLFDRKVYKVIEQIITDILKEKGKIKNPIPLGSLYNLCKRMNIENYGGAEYKKIKKALEKIRATTIKSVGTFYSKGVKQWVDDSFSLYDRIVFKGKKLSNNEIADNNYLFLGSWYLQSLNSFYVKPIDYDYLQSLKSKIASRLYEILGVKFYGLRNKRDNYICYRYSKLYQLLPVTPHEYILQLNDS